MCPRGVNSMVGSLNLDIMSLSLYLSLHHPHHSHTTTTITLHNRIFTFRDEESRVDQPTDAAICWIRFDKYSFGSVTCSMC